MRTLWTSLAIATVALAQETPRPKHNASYVPDDAETIRALVAQATEAAHAGNVDGAVEGLQALVLTTNGGVVAVRGRELFVSARRWAALQLLSERPPFGRETLVAWRKLHGQTSNSAITAALANGHEESVLRLVARYPAASAAPGALLALSDRALARGDPDRAMGHLLRAAEHVSVSKKAAWLLADAYRLRRRHLDAVAPRRTADWSTLGGDNSRARNGDALPGVTELKMMWETPLLELVPQAFAHRAEYTLREHSPMLPFYPVFDARHIYVHLGSRIAVLSRRTGKLLYFAPDNRRVDEKRLDQLLAASPGLRAATINSGVLYFNRVLFSFGRSPLRHNSLVAFDTKRRSVLWEVRHGPGKKPAALRKQIFFRGAPAIERGRLYVYGAVRERSEGKPSRKEEAYLYCFEARTGALIWSRFLGYGDTEAAPELPPQSGLAPAVRHGVVVVVSGLGVAAALDATSGEILWLLRYDRKPIRERERLTEWTEKQVHVGSGWFREAPRIVGDRVFLTPLDSDQRYGCWLRGHHDANDGEFYLQQWAVARNANPGRNSLLEQVAGIRGDRIYYVGRRDDRTGSVETYQTVVSNPVGRGEDSFAYARIPAVERDRAGLRVPPEVFGRVTIAGSALLVPTRRVLFRFDVGRTPKAAMRGSERFQEIPPLTPFAPDPIEALPGEAPPPLFGTLVALKGRLYAVTASRVVCYGAK